MSELLIYTPKLTPRITYTFSLFFSSLIQTPYKITTDVSEYSNYNGPRLNYSDKPVAPNEVFIASTNLLLETGIKPQSIAVTEWEGMKIFYQSNGTLPFDVFAASFYLVTRYEEYLPYESDKHKRFRPMDSLAFKNQFIDMPLVNLWADKLKQVLQSSCPSVEIKENTYIFTPTIDVDVAYAHKGRKLYITLGAYLKALAKFDFGAIGNKTLTLLRLKADEYDTYDYQKEVFQKNGVNPIYFFLTGVQRTAYDKNIDVTGRSFIELVKKVSAFARVGIHPSYMSLDNKEAVETELLCLTDILGNKVSLSRQHFLRIALPETYRNLTALGITDDYSMAYAACPGFRASICTPYFFYDLKDEKELPIRLHPSIVMDGTLNEYINVSPDEAITLTRKLLEQVKQCKGEFVSIWHNDTLNDKDKWKGWKRVFETIIEAAK